MKKDGRIETKRLNIVEATPEDVESIIEIESHKDNRDFIWIGTKEQHLAEIEDPNHLLLLFRTKEEDRIVGYALARIDWKSEVFELRRIAIVEKGMGFGRETMEAIMRFAFTELGTNRFWLDVYPDNLIGIRLYESLGLHLDGVLRQNYKASRGYLDQIIYSMLKSEYFAQ
jgi:[ribosomal protein S5]-alanine N-acetyltransferase